jgi:signal transduction histidine kinase/HAMP domain-containing protein
MTGVLLQQRWTSATGPGAVAAATTLVLLLVAMALATRDGAEAWLAAVLAAGVAASVVVARRAGRRGPWLLAAALQALPLMALLAAQPAVRRDDGQWARRELERAGAELTAAAEQARVRYATMAAFTDTLAAAAADPAATADPFAACARWVDRWDREYGGADSLAVGMWVGGERLGWAGPVVAAAGAPGPADAGPVRDEHWWVLRTVRTVPGLEGLRVECQLRLARVSDRPAAPRTSGRIHRAVVRDARAPGTRTWGDADRGLRLVEDVVLQQPDGHGVSARLRLTLEAPPRSLQDERGRAVRVLAGLVALGLALLSWAWGVAGPWGVCAGCWVVRGVWAAADLTRWLAAAAAARNFTPGPGHPMSLLDPSYFASGLGDGWFACGADALLTGALAAGTAGWLWRQLRPAGDAGRPTRRRWWPLAALLGAGAGLALARLWQEIAANANPRLIGLQAALESWSFWALHAAILMISLAAGALLLLVLGRLLGRRPWAGSPAARPLWLAGGLLAAVAFNYVVLADAYGRTERDWLRRKAEQIVQPQDDWISFLAEDALGDMAGRDRGADDEEASPGSETLTRDLAAYRLWSRSAVRDLGLPCLIEVIDGDGRTASLYATGFLRDFGYEVVERSDWWSLAEAGEEGGGRIGVMLQDEVRRYPTGRERILRGEIPRDGGQGWLRLELPVQSLRIATLSARLTGAGETVAAGGYRPRVEVDQPLLLLRGDRERWLDAGFGDLPEHRLIDDLRHGRREWATLALDGNHWLCRWATLPEPLQNSPGEGFLLGLRRRGAVDILLDMGRLLLLDVVLLAGLFLVRGLVRRRWDWLPGFQGRFLLGYLVIGVVLLLVAGVLADRQTFQRLDREARDRTRDGLVTAMGQLRGLLAEQARALAASDYIAELLTGRLSGERPTGPFDLRQGMVFGPDGSLLLDETLSDLDEAEVARLLDAAREGPLVAVRQPDGLYLGVLIPIDLGDLPGVGGANGAFFYRQRVDDQLLPALADVVGGEITLRVDGEVVDTSHPGRVFSGENPALAPPSLMQWFRRHPGQPRLEPRPAGLGFTGGASLPALALDDGGRLRRQALPAVLSVEFPDRERDYVGQRRRMGLFLAGLVTVLLMTAFGLAMALTWNIFEPLRVLLGATRRLADGDYAAPLPPPGADEVGRLAAGFRTMRDQLHAARASLEARERFLRVVLERVPVGVLVWDDAGRVAAVNPAADAILERFYPPTDGAAGPAARVRRLHDDLDAQLGGADAGELRSDDGRRTLRVGRAPMELGDEAPHQLLVCEDLTEFLAAKKQALNAEMARQVAHEIKNPLTPIQLSVQLLQQAYADGHPQLDRIMTDAVQRILDQVQLLRTIAGEFSLLGRPGELPREALDLPALVRDVLAGYVGAPDDDGRIVMEARDLPPVLAHRESLLKVLGNLMQNSLDAVGDPQDLRLQIAWRVEPGQVDLVWRDNGPGIGDDVAGRLFDPYFSTKSKGTGLGLAICRNLLETMDGAITLANRPDGAGAEAVVSLPRADA